MTDRYLHVLGDESKSVFALGDCADIHDMPLPCTAQVYNHIIFRRKQYFSVVWELHIKLSINSAASLMSQWNHSEICLMLHFIIPLDIVKY